MYYKESIKDYLTRSTYEGVEIVSDRIMSVIDEEDNLFLEELDI